MPDTKLSALTKITSACSVDLVYLAHDPSGTVISAAISASSLFQSVPSAGLIIGGDVNLYRGTSNFLITDDDFGLYNSNKKIYFGDSVGGYDTNLYRVSTNRLMTDDSFEVVGTVLVQADIYLGGVLYFNYSAKDTALYRSAANMLKTDGSFIVSTAGSMVISGLAGGGRRAIYVDNNGNIVV